MKQKNIIINDQAMLFIFYQMTNIKQLITMCDVCF